MNSIFISGNYMSIIKSPNDNRNYENIILPNNLQVLIISDPKTTIASASLTVNVGYYFDPKGYDGLAHFLEHMLFMGTGKYPDVNHFMSFINKHGGKTNAYTAPDTTNYHYSVLNKYFEESLDIFGQFFIDPLFLLDYVNKEINAVNSEHSKNIMSTPWRINRLHREVTNPKSQYYNFGTGSIDTLLKDDIRDKLVEFYNKYYSSDIMKLVVYSALPIDKMKNIITKIFSLVKNNNTKDIVNINIIDPYDNKKEGYKYYKVVKTIPVEKLSDIILYFKIPNPTKDYKYKPISYFCELINSQDNGTLIYKLKELSLINFLSCGIIESVQNMAMLSIDVNLTKKGMKFVPQIIDAIDNYIKLIKDKGIEKWRYDQKKIMYDIMFKSIAKGQPLDYVSDLSPELLLYKPEEILSHSYMLDDYTEHTKNIIKKYMDYIRLDNCVIIISSLDYAGKTNRIEKHYGVNYIVTENTNSLGNEFENKSIDELKKLSLPTKNKFIPNKVTILKQIKDKNTDKPKLILNEKNKQVYYKKDNTFNTPKVLMEVIINNNMIFANLHQYTLFSLYLRLIYHKFRPILTKIYSANVDVSIRSSYDTLRIGVKGYNENIESVIKEIIGIFFEPNYKKNDYDIVLNNFKSDLENEVFSAPYILINDYISEKIIKRNFTFFEILNELNIIKFDDLTNIKKWFEDNAKIACLIQGNCSENDALKYFSYFEKQFSVKNKQNYQGLPEIINILKKGTEEVYMRKSFNPSENNSCISVYYEIAKYSEKSENYFKKICLLFFIDAIISEKFFHKLRSIEQSGYVVKAFIKVFGSGNNYIIGENFLIQSEKINPNILRYKIRKFIKRSLKTIEHIDSNSFDKYKHNLIERFLEPDNNIVDEFYINYSGIIKGDVETNIPQKLANITKKIKKNDIIEFYKKYFVDKYSRKIRVAELYGNQYFKN